MKRKCAPGFVAVQPVQFACGHRYHEVSEEVFYIIRTMPPCVLRRVKRI